MLLNYQYRTYLDTKQKIQLNEWLRIGRYWYNYQLGDRFNWWEQNRNYAVFPQGEFCQISCSLPPLMLRDNPNYYSQKKLLPVLKKDFVRVKHSGELLDYTKLPSQTMQDISRRVDIAFKRFLAGDSNGKRSGKPRFKNTASFRTLKIEGQAITIERTEKEWLFISASKLSGWLKIRLHRPLPQGFQLKNILLTRKADGWYATIALFDPTVPTFNPDDVVPTWDNSLGMDAVLLEDDYLATSQNTKLPNVKSFRKNQLRLGLISKRKAAKKKGSKSRRKLALSEARHHQRIARSRKDHAYKTAHAIVRTGKKVFYHEDLNLRGLTKRNKKKIDADGKFLKNGQSSKSGLNKSWNDAAFGQFFTTLDYIASKAGAVVVKVNPAYTSMLLSYRDEFVFTDCSIRNYFDPIESLNVDRDINSAVNIKRVGLGLFPTIKRRKGNPVVGNSITNSTSKEVLAALRNVPEAYTIFGTPN
ncbi:MAG: transposase [Scytonema sp. CRU_2_7]|nr:transposase [Scytonema sp. CRU_2_7]